MLQDIEVVLEKEWKSIDGEHAKTIYYYITGTVLRMVEKQSNNEKEELASVFRDLKSNASTTRDKAKQQFLPYQRVQSVEAVSLSCPTSEFYQVMLKIESVFHNMWKDDNVALFGLSIVGDTVLFVYWVSNMLDFLSLSRMQQEMK